MQNSDDANHFVIGDVIDAYCLKTSDWPGTQILKTGITCLITRTNVGMFSQVLYGATYGI